TRIPRELPERVQVRDRRELRLLGAEADVAGIPVDEEVGRRPVDELVTGLGDSVPHRRRDPLAVNVARDGDLLEEDVLDPELVDPLADRPDPLAPAGIVPGLVQSRKRIRNRPLGENLLNLRWT